MDFLKNVRDAVNRCYEQGLDPVQILYKAIEDKEKMEAFIHDALNYD